MHPSNDKYNPLLIKTISSPTGKSTILNYIHTYSEIKNVYTTIKNTSFVNLSVDCLKM